MKRLDVQEASVREEMNRPIHSSMHSLRCDYILHALGCVWRFKVRAYSNIA